MRNGSFVSVDLDGVTLSLSRALLATWSDAVETGYHIADARIAKHSLRERRAEEFFAQGAKAPARRGLSAYPLL
jgi:hypothetical protein